MPLLCMSAQPPHPELKAHLGRVIRVKCGSERVIFGTLVGYDHFMNLSLRNVRVDAPGLDSVTMETTLVRGACVLSFEAINV